MLTPGLRCCLQARFGEGPFAQGGGLEARQSDYRQMEGY